MPRSASTMATLTLCQHSVLVLAETQWRLPSGPKNAPTKLVTLPALFRRGATVPWPFPRSLFSLVIRLTLFLASHPPRPQGYRSCLCRGCAVCHPPGSEITSTAPFPLTRRPFCACRRGPQAARGRFGVRDAPERCSVCFRHVVDLWQLGAGP